MSNPLYVIPSNGGTVPVPLSMATTETLPIAFDYTLAMAGGDVVSAPTSVIVNTSYGVNAGQTITPSASPTIAGNVVTQVVAGSQLAGYNSYRLEITATLNTNKVVTGALTLNVPF